MSYKIILSILSHLLLNLYIPVFFSCMYLKVILTQEIHFYTLCNLSRISFISFIWNYLGDIQSHQVSECITKSLAISPRVRSYHKVRRHVGEIQNDYFLQAILHEPHLFLFSFFGFETILLVQFLSSWILTLIYLVLKYLLDYRYRAYHRQCQ